LNLTAAEDEAEVRKIWRQDGRYARSSGVLHVLCPRSLKIESMKGYAGGLGASASNV